MTKPSIKDALAIKRLNAAHLITIIKAEVPGTVQATSLSLNNFQSVIRKLCVSRRFAKVVLPEILAGRFEIYEAISPRPAPELCLWAAERLASPDSQLAVRNAQSWRELICGLFSEKDTLLAEELGPPVIEQIRNGFDAWKHQNPDVFRPIFKELPTTISVRALFSILLGRPPNKNDDVQGRRQQGYPAIIRSLLRSSEFQANFLKWLGQRGLPEGNARKTAARDSAKEIERAFAWQDDGGPNLGLAAGDWSDLLDAIWLVDSRREDLLSLLSDDHDPIDAFVKSFIDQACRRVASGERQAVVTALLEHGEVEAFILNNGPAENVEVKVVTSGGTNLAAQLIEVPAYGRTQVRLGLDWSSWAKLHGDEAFWVHLNGEAEEKVSVRRRPFLGKATTLAATTAWNWAKGRFPRAERTLFDLEGASDPGLAHTMEKLHWRLVGEDKAGPTLIALRQPEWSAFSEAVAARKEAFSLAEPLPEGVESWLFEQKDVGRAVTAWLCGTVEKGDLAATLNAVGTASPTSTFTYLVSQISRQSDLLKLLQALAIIMANDEHLAAIVTELAKHPANRVNTELRKNKYAIALGGAICACAALPAQTAQRLDVIFGAIKYCEASGRPSKALEIALAAVDQDRSMEKINLASMLSQKWGDPEKAADLLKLAAEKQPHNVDLMERYLSLERGVCMADPLRATPELAKMKRRFREGRVKALIQKPGDTERLHALAKALLIEGNEAGALDILSDLHRRGELDSDGLKQLIDLGVKTGDNTRVVEICESLNENELSEWLVINHVRALRALDRAEEASALLDRHASGEWQSVSREAIRNHFFLADFEIAAQLGEALVERQPEDLELRLVVAAAHFELNDIYSAGKILEKARELPKAIRFREELDLYGYAIARKNGAYLAIRKLNPMFRRLGCSDLTIKRGASGNFDDFALAPEQEKPEETEYPPLTDGPLVSVVMTSFNSSDFIDTAIESILNQRYRNIELIVVDDMSTDDTPDKLLRWRDNDSRVRPILKTENSGTYVSKNMGLLSAVGTYAALHDSDDWSHPDRIGKSVAVLEQRRDLQALTTDWLRMTTNGHLMVKAGGQISHVCCISLVFRRQPVIDAIGLFDSVRIEADMEYIRRIQLAFGHRALARLRWPLLFGRVRSDSLTGNEEFGISRTGFSPPRLEYQAHQAAWHDEIRSGGSPFMPFPLESRKFNAPGIILPNRPDEATT